MGFDDLGIPRDEELERLSIGEAKREAQRIRRRLSEPRP
jgi:hypothetical protein